MKHRGTKWLLVVFLAAWIGLATSTPAHAMHISEGILPLGWCVFWFILAAPFVAIGLRRLKHESAGDLSFKPLVGLMAAAVFIISCIPIPVPTAGTCSHPCGTAMSAILLGPFISVLVASVALLIQALFLAHGGLSTLGANIVSMGVMGSFSGYLVFRLLRGVGAGLWIAGFFAGLLADWVTYLGTSIILASALKGGDPFLPLMTKIAIAFVPTQLPLGILEGAMTAGMVALLHKKRPDLLVKMRVIKAPRGGVAMSAPGRSLSCRYAGWVLFVALLLLPVLAPLNAAESKAKWQGVDESVVEKVATEHGRAAHAPLINTDQGDLLLFVFLIAGALGGFVAGYYWRSLTERPDAQVRKGGE